VKSIDKFPRLVSNTLLRKIFLKLAKSWDSEKHHTQGWIVPLNHDLKYEQDYKNVVLPIELVRKAVEESSYRAIMNKCMCRAGHKCTHYPIDKRENPGLPHRIKSGYIEHGVYKDSCPYSLRLKMLYKLGGS